MPSIAALHTVGSSLFGFPDILIFSNGQNWEDCCNRKSKIICFWQKDH